LVLTPILRKWYENGIAGKLIHALLYLLLFAVPLTAIASAWLEGHPLTLLAGIKIAPALAESHSTGATIASVHTWLGDAIMWVAGIHALAGLFHHFILQDGVLVSMLPRWLSFGKSKGD
jgi:cytochrome b561